MCIAFVGTWLVRRISSALILKAKFFYEHAFQSKRSSPLLLQQQQQQQLQQRVGTTIIYSGKFSKMISRNVKWLTTSGSAAVAQRPMLKRFIRYVLNSRFFGTLTNDC